MDKFHEVSKSETCPVCGHDHWCIVSNDGEVCICRRTESARPAKSGSGWIHRLSGVDGCSLMVDGSRQTTGNQQPATNNQQPATYFAALPRGDIQTRLCAYLERELGLPREMLEMHDVRWDGKARAAAFPMRDAEGNVTGIRYRQLKTGRKWALKGSKDGLFYIRGFVPYGCEELVVCEGPTDMLAACSCGLNAVGRSSCMTGAALLREFIRARRIRRVTIAADDDKPKPLPNGKTWRPGYDGALRLAAALRVPARIALPFPGNKDLREWYAKGEMTGDKFRQAAAASWLDEYLVDGC